MIICIALESRKFCGHIVVVAATAALVIVVFVFVLIIVIAALTVGCNSGDNIGVVAGGMAAC